jgi:hypothetical protein
VVTETVFEISNSPITLREILSVSPDGNEPGGPDVSARG